MIRTLQMPPAEVLRLPLPSPPDVVRVNSPWLLTSSTASAIVTLLTLTRLSFVFSVRTLGSFLLDLRVVFVVPIAGVPVTADDSKGAAKRTAAAGDGERRDSMSTSSGIAL